MSKKFDDYMANIARHLRDLPANVRENELIEMRSHLDQLRDDFTAQGQGREMAAQSALDQFGDARTVGIHLRDVWEGQDFSWKQVLAALICGSTFWVATTLALLIGVFRFSFWPRAALFPELPVLILVGVALVPFLTGIIFSCWLGRRGWICSGGFFGGVMLLIEFGHIYSVHISLPTITIGTFPVPLMVLNLGGGIIGALASDALQRRHRHARLALAGPVSSAMIDNGVSSFNSRHKKLLLRASMALTLFIMTVAGAKWRIDAIIHPQTPVAALRARLLTNDDVTQHATPKILELRELAPQTPAERAGLERRVAFHIKVSATENYRARRISYLESRLKSAQEKTAWGEAALRSSLRRVRANSHPIRGVATLKKASEGWQVDEKSFNWSRLRGWILDVYSSG